MGSSELGGHWNSGGSSCSQMRPGYHFVMTEEQESTGKRFAKCCIEERSSYGGGSCMIGIGISMEARTDPTFIHGGNYDGVFNGCNVH